MLFFHSRLMVEWLWWTFILPMLTVAYMLISVRWQVTNDSLCFDWSNFTQSDHIDYIKKVAGIDHVGIGSDFNGIS